MRPLNQDNEEMIPESPNLPGNGTENLSDEANILADQDETLLANPADNDVNIGSDGSDEYGLDNAEFANGEIDVKEQMDRATANMNANIHRPTDRDTTPHSREGQVDTTASLQDSMRRRQNKH
jgi:hypothetical protein